MPKFIALLCACAVAAFGALGLAWAGDRPQASPAVYLPSEAAQDTLFSRVASKPCCYNNGEFFNSTPKTCRKYGGRVVAYDYCERQYWGQWGQWNGGFSEKPCCYNNGQYFNAKPGTCRRYGGFVVSQDRCNGYYTGQWGQGPWSPGWNNGWNNGYQYNAGKPCCYNNGQYFNSSPSTCRKYGGQTVPQQYCTGGYPRSW
jgi:hypothetical protein